VNERFVATPFLSAWTSFTNRGELSPRQRQSPSPNPNQLYQPEQKAMAKGIEGKKQAKKPPTKTMKEKRAAKKAKKAARG
jgi:hypothetical protein